MMAMGGCGGIISSHPSCSTGIFSSLTKRGYTSRKKFDEILKFLQNTERCESDSGVRLCILIPRDGSSIQVQEYTKEFTKEDYKKVTIRVQGKRKT